MYLSSVRSYMWQKIACFWLSRQDKIDVFDSVRDFVESLSTQHWDVEQKMKTKKPFLR